MRHVAVMSFSASAGLLSMFVVDFVDLYFISLLGDLSQTAGVGFAGSLLFFNISISIGLMIAMSALGARRIGRHDMEGARQIATNVIMLSIVVSVVFSALFWIFTPQLLDLIGATGDAKMWATKYLRIVAPSMPVLVLSMTCSGLLRAHGDAKRAMNVTLASGLVNAVLDPILIFSLSMGLEGAAYASVIARICSASLAILPILRHYGGFARFEQSLFYRDLMPILKIAVPAILTNIATPVGSLIVMRFIAPFGDEIIAGYAVLGRLTPLVFCVIFALSGAVGPIIGQNFGAHNHTRVHETVLSSFKFTAAYSLAAWVLMLVFSNQIGILFGLAESGQNLMRVFALIITPLFFFNGVLFIANACFNNLNRPNWSAMLNWGKNTIGVAPFVWLGAKWGNAEGVMIGQAIGGVLFAVLAAFMLFRLVEAYQSGRLAVEE